MSKNVHLHFIIMIAVLILLSGPSSGSNAAFLATDQWVTPLEIDFGPVGVGALSKTIQVTVTNSGANPLTNWSGGAVSPPFNVTQDCISPGGVLPGHTCHYSFSFSPTTAGTFTSTSTTTNNAGSFGIRLHGTGVGAQATYDAHALDFGNVETNPRFPPVVPTQVVTIKNTGLAPLTGWAGGGVNPPFNAAQNCNISGGVQPGDSCQYFFSFSPGGGAGSYTATSSSTSSGGPIKVDLAGSSHLLIFGDYQRVTPSSIDFGPVGIGQTATMDVTYTNQSAQDSVTNWAGGAVSTPFNASQDCVSASPLAPGASCHFTYTFTPTASGSFSTVSSVSTTFGANQSSNFKITMQGTGVAPSLFADALWLNFGPVVKGFSSPAQVVTLTNTGLSPITGLTEATVSAPFSLTQDCPTPGGLMPGQSCHFYIAYHPTDVGLAGVDGSFSTNASTFHIKLIGTGIVANSLYLPVLTHP